MQISQQGDFRYWHWTANVKEQSPVSSPISSLMVHEERIISGHRMGSMLCFVLISVFHVYLDTQIDFGYYCYYQIYYNHA